MPLATGDLVLLLSGEAHQLCNAARLDGAVPLQSHPSPEPPWALPEDPCPGTRLIMGTIRFPGGTGQPLTALLPPLLHLSTLNEGGLLGKVATATVAASQDVSATQPVFDRLGEALVVQALYMHLRTRPATEAGWLRAAADPEIGPVLLAMLSHPDRDWSVASLAEAGSLARSTFARKFRELVDCGPMDFLLDVRMRRAARRLADDDADLKSVARAVGYRSTAAFSVAFKRWSGVAPSRFDPRAR
jgi:AraC-like DNA-binding protein